MKFGSTFLVAGLLVLPPSGASATTPVAGMYINVPYELTGIPDAAREVYVSCRVGVGPTSGDSIWPNTTAVGYGRVEIKLPPAPGSRGKRGVARVPVAASGTARQLSEATHYSCALSSAAGKPEMKGEHAVTGAIPKT